MSLALPPRWNSTRQLGADRLETPTATTLSWPSSEAPLRGAQSGQAIKHAAIRDAAMIDDLTALDPADQHPSADLLARNLAIKARIVEEDERETAGTRALLNFGHTIGHGIEASLPYGAMLHGEAISLGIKSALFLSEKINGFPTEQSQRILNLLKNFQLPLTLPEDISTDTIMDKLSRDKKFTGGKIKFVLLTAPGAAEVSAGLAEVSAPASPSPWRSTTSSHRSLCMSRGHFCQRSVTNLRRR